VMPFIATTSTGEIIDLSRLSYGKQCFSIETYSLRFVLIVAA
jgi:hypothetical protein